MKDSLKLQTFLKGIGRCYMFGLIFAQLIQVLFALITCDVPVS